MNWVLIFFFSVGFGSAQSGGPMLIDGFTTEQKCMDAKARISKLRGHDFSYCVQATK